MLVYVCLLHFKKLNTIVQSVLKDGVYSRLNLALEQQQV